MSYEIFENEFQTCKIDKDVLKYGKVILNSKEGELFLKQLRDVYLVNESVALWEANERFDCFREGQNNIVRMLLFIGGLIRNERVNSNTK